MSSRRTALRHLAGDGNEVAEHDLFLEHRGSPPPWVSVSNGSISEDEPHSPQFTSDLEPTEAAKETVRISASFKRIIQLIYMDKREEAHRVLEDALGFLPGDVVSLDPVPMSMDSDKFQIMVTLRQMQPIILRDAEDTADKTA